MKYEDRIYGKVEIRDSAAIDLIGSSSMQRLKGVSQHGHFEPFFPGTSYSRFEHSLGVFILLGRFGAPSLERLAGLIHDVSHTVFSHVADYVFGEGCGKKQDFQDNCFEKFVADSEIPEILKSHGIDYRKLLNDSDFPLKEKSLPDLCADRIDYFLRELRVIDKGNEAGMFLENLAVSGNDWFFKKEDAAVKFAHYFLEINNRFWSGPETAAMFAAMGDLIRYAVEKGVLTVDDLFTTDNNVWLKINSAAAKDEKLNLLSKKANNEFNYELCEKEEDCEAHVFCKSRVVDPLFMENGVLRRLSEKDAGFRELKEKYSRPKEYFIRSSYDKNI